MAPLRERLRALLPGAALVLAAAAALPAPLRILDGAWGAPLPPDEIGALDRALAPLRPLLPARAGHCVGVDPAQVAGAPADALRSFRLARRFLAQYALAPAILVPVLGQPANGFADPPPADRAARLAELDVLVIEAPPSSDCWRGAVAAGFAPERVVGPAVLFRRVTR